MIYEPSHQESSSLDDQTATDEGPPQAPLSPVIYHPLSLHVLALLAPASILGTLARLGLQALGTYEGQGIFPLAYPQSVGCFVMGVCLGLKEPFSRFHGPFYTALTTGFCGSLTTFSDWQLDVFNSWINSTGAERGGLRDFVDGIGKTSFTLVIALASVSLGTHASSLLAPLFPAFSPPSSATRSALTSLAILSYAATLPTYFLLPLDFRHQATAALLFSFPGTLTRYILSWKLNPYLDHLPLGTLAANSFGTALLATFHVLRSLPTSLPPGACAILQGLADGYCGCLTTISTFAVEIKAQTRRRGLYYAILSWSIGQLLLLLIFGASMWTGHARSRPTCSFI
ncbi:CrcB-like protein-domain-containing protein [Infundibulicybe gibba]|nr:CrcB-like protein-domain-containing protein [Infundibulicybe gibba]